MKRVWILIPIVLVAAAAMWRPPAGPAIAPATPESRQAPHGHARFAQRERMRATGSAVIVYVVGAVVRPGLYAVSDDARVDDAVRKAGGFARGADPAAVNLAARTSDGDEIDVPLVGEAARPAMRAKPARGRRQPRSKAPPAVIDLNRADAVALQRVPGIGPTLAERIVAVRDRDGPFASYDQLLDVAGMTQARLDRAQPYLNLKD